MARVPQTTNPSSRRVREDTIPMETGVPLAGSIPMRIGIDGACWNNRRGYGRFVRELLGAVEKCDDRNQYTIFLDSEPLQEVPSGGKFSFCCARTGKTTSEAAAAGSRRSVTDLMRMSRSVSRHKLDLFFFPSVYSYFPIFNSVPIVVGIHDTIADRNPSFAFDSCRQEIFWNLKVKLAIRQAATVLTVSEYSRRCLEHWLRVRPERIRVLYEAASSRFQPAPPDPGRRPYFLYVGGISPNKNLAALIRAFEGSYARRAGAQLILAGDYESDGFKNCYKSLAALVSSLGINANVLFPGFVPEADLCKLYSGAIAFALPSFDEGFGLPVIEAMACGVPVIVSTGNALEEVAGGAGLSAGPEDVKAWTDCMDRIFTDVSLARELSRKALERSRLFSWDLAAGQLLKIFDETRREALN